MSKGRTPIDPDVSYTDEEINSIEADPIRISLSGHTCAGKTEWLSGLLGVRVGKVSPHPDTTVQIAWTRFSLPDSAEGTPYIQIADVPGQQFSGEVLKNARAELGARPKPRQMEEFINRQKEIEGDHKSDIELLDHFRQCDAIIYLADCQDEPVVSVEDEFELVRRLGRPVIAVLNFSSPQVQANREILGKWREAFEAEGAQSVLELDAFDKDPDAIRELGEVLERVFHKNPVKAKFMRKYWQDEIITKEEERLDEAVDILANFLTDATTFAVKGDLAKGNDLKANEKKLKKEFQTVTLEKIGELSAAIMEAYPEIKADFRAETDSNQNKSTEDSKRHPGPFGNNLAIQVPKSMGRGAIIGGLIGLAGDLMVGGFSGGGIAMLGAAVGAAIDVGFSLKVRKTPLGAWGTSLEIQLSDKTISTCCLDGLALIDTMRRRGLGNTEPLNIKARRNCLPAPDEVLEMLKAKRAKHSWSQWNQKPRSSDNRQKFVGALSVALRRVLDNTTQNPIKAQNPITKFGTTLYNRCTNVIQKQQQQPFQ
jgi:hypothetical protein